MCFIPNEDKEGHTPLLAVLMSRCKFLLCYFKCSLSYIMHAIILLDSIFLSFQYAYHALAESFPHGKPYCNATVGNPLVRIK